MTNFFDNNQDARDVCYGKYCFVGDYLYGRRVVGIYTDKMQYGIEIKGEVVSPWFDALILMPSFNVCQKDGKSFLTSANGKERISGEYKEIGRFERISVLERYYAKVKGFDNKFGTLSSEGKIGVECSHEQLIRFGKAFAVCSKKIDGVLRYGIRVVNGEQLVDYSYTSYKVVAGKVCLTSEEGKTVAYNALGWRVKV